MANKYYYLVSSLPFIAFEKRTPVTSEGFLSECRKWLTEEDLKNIGKIKAENLEVGLQDRGFVREWKEFDITLKNALREARTARQLVHEERIHGVAKDILDESTPLDAEKKFEQMRWHFLEEKERDYYFDLNWLMVYYLKIQISERLAEFKKDVGMRVFEEASEVVYG